MTPATLEAELASLHEASFGWALACCRRDPELAREVLQQAYWKVLSGRARFEGRAALKTWFFGVVRLTAREERRWAWLRWDRTTTRDPVAEAEAAPVSPDEAVDAARQARALAVALAELPDRQREVLHLVFYEGLPVREAAAVMRVSAGTAALHYDRGKRALAARLTRPTTTSP